MSRVVAAVLAVLVACGGACMHHDRGADVVVGYEDRGSTVTLATGQTLAVELWSGGSAGLDPWVVATAPDPAVLALVRSEHEVPRDPMPGSTSTDRFVFDATGAGSTALAATSRSHYGETTTFELRIVVRGAVR